jgi:uncharacterized protein YndB with AHSA1/START domain
VTDRIDRAARIVAAGTAATYAALTDPDALVRWLPPEGMSAVIERFDLRPGGSYRMVLTYDDASDAPGKATDATDVVEARFTEIVDGQRVVQQVDFVADDPAVAGTMTMTWRVSPVEGGTLVELEAEHVPSGISPEDHAAGMSSSLRNLEAYLER